MFGKSTLQPFRLFRARIGTLYAYSPFDESALRNMADTVAPPQTRSIIRPDKIRAKPIPSNFRAGQLLGFDLRTRPVRCLKKPVLNSNNETIAKGEIDAHVLDMLPRTFKHDSPSARPTSREQSYRRWLAERLAGAADVSVLCISSLRTVMSPRHRNNSASGPDAVFHGELEIVDPKRFSHILQHGIGRHKAYGYGMLLLRPPNRKAR